jgi:hypothetical protein
MSQQYSIRFPFSVLIPEEIANSIPDFPMDQYTPTDVPISSSGIILLSNDEIETEIEQKYYSNQLAFNYFEVAEKMVETLVIEDNAVVGMIEFADEDDPTEIFEVLAKHNIVVTPITA